MDFGIFTSAWDQAAIGLVEFACDSTRNGMVPNSRVSFVFCSREEGENEFGDEMIAMVRKQDVSLITFSAAKFEPELKRKNIQKWRRRYDGEVIKRLPRTDFDVMLGYMLVSTEKLIGMRNVVNLHPTLPGGSPGTYIDITWRLMEERASETGVMIHLVDNILDGGQPIAWCRFSINGPEFESEWARMELRRQEGSIEAIKEAERLDNDLFKKIRQKGVVRELPLLVATLANLAAGKLVIKNGKVSDQDGRILEKGRDLTNLVEAMVKGDNYG